MNLYFEEAKIPDKIHTILFLPFFKLCINIFHAINVFNSFGVFAITYFQSRVVTLLVFRVVTALNGCSSRSLLTFVKTKCVVFLYSRSILGTDIFLFILFAISFKINYY